IGTNNSPKLFAGDLKYFSRTKEAWPLIHPDGSITNEIIPCLRVDENNPTAAGTTGAAFQTTVKDFLWMELEVGEDYDYGEDYLNGINFESSFTCSSGNVKMITCPLLLMGHTAGYEFITAEWSYNNAISKDKTIAFTEGATHGWSTIDKDKYGDTILTEAKYVTGWLTEKGRFI
ncbi:MAG: alpha/beta hydrolase, partial [Clostridium fessum]|nr:alpha/beta hydrolase [Clostridium fessum]